MSLQSDVSLVQSNEDRVRHHAAMRVQRYWRSHRVSPMVITVPEMEQFLSSSFEGVNKEKLKLLSKVISDLSVQMLINPNSFKGEGIRVTRHTISSGGKAIGRFPNLLPFWMQLSPDAKEMRLQFYGKFIAECMYKKVKHSKTMILSLARPGRKEMKLVQTVLYRLRRVEKQRPLSVLYPKEIEDLTETNIRLTFKSLTLMNDLLDKEKLCEDPKFKIAGISKVFRIYQSEKVRRVEWEGLYFPNVAETIAETKKISFEEQGKPLTITAEIGNICDILNDALYTCKKMHEKGIVHRDLKPKNLLVRINPETKKAEGYTIDFDLTSFFGFNNTTVKYGYWDRASIFGIVLPSCDIFGIGIALGELLFSPEFLENSEKRYKQKNVPKEDVARSNLMGLIKTLNKSIAAAVTDMEPFKGQIPKLSEYLENLAKLQNSIPSGKIFKDVFAAIKPIRELAKEPDNREIKGIKEVAFISERLFVENRFIKRSKQAFDEGWMLQNGGILRLIKSSLNDLLIKKEEQLWNEFCSAMGKCLDDYPVQMVELEILKKKHGRFIILPEKIECWMKETCGVVPETKPLCDKYLADIQAYRAIAKLLLELFEQDEGLFHFLLSDPDGIETCKQLCTPSFPLNKKQELISMLFKRFPIFGTFQERLQEIQKNWQDRFYSLNFK